MGGMHGAGKTTCCKELRQRLKCSLVRQHKQIIDVAQSHGVTHWEESLRKHDLFIEKAAVKTVSDFLMADSFLLLVDCHYAILRTKALRETALGRQEIYIPDLDIRFARIIKENFRVRLVLFSIHPEIAYSRLRERMMEDVPLSVDVLKAQKGYEERFFNLFVEDLNLPPGDALAVDTDCDLDSVIVQIEEFIRLI